MPNAAASPGLLLRDRCLLQALYLSPWTPEQLLAIAKSTWPQPFHHYKTLLRRLTRLSQPDMSWVSRHTFQSGLLPSRHSYFRIAPAGYAQLMQDEQAVPPGNFSFGCVPPDLERHAYGLSIVIAHLFSSAPSAGIRVGDCEPDGAQVHRLERHHTIPDFSFSLFAGSGEQFNFAVEFDRATKSQRSRLTSDALEHMVQSYEALHYHSRGLGRRSVVLFITEAGEGRRDNFLETVREVTVEPRCSLFKAATLNDFLQAANPFTAPVFRDIQGRSLGMIPRYAKATWQPAHFSLEEFALPAQLL